MRVSRGGFLSPVVRRLLSEHGLDPSEVTGTGAGGRITRQDVEAAVAARMSAAAPEPAAAPEAAVVPEPPPPPPRTDAIPLETTPAEHRTEEIPAVAEAPRSPTPASPQLPERSKLVPFTKIRRRISDNLVASLAAAAHAFCAVEADFERVDRVRREHAAAWREEEGISLTYLPFVARAVVGALVEFPHLNSSVTADGLLVHQDVHLGIAVDLDHEGLIVPVVRDAGGKRLREIAREISDLAQRARAGRLRPDDVVGGTFTITNPGPSGTLLSVPIINQPEVGILSTDTVRRRPVAVALADGGEGFTVHAVGMLGLSFDHRAVDGAYAASFVSRVKELVETRDWATEL